MRRFVFLRCTLFAVVAVASVSLASQVYAGFMIEVDYVNQGKGVAHENVEGGRWVWESANTHAYWMSEGPDLDELMLTNSIRTSIWRTDKYGDVKKHYFSVVTDLKDYLDESCLSKVSRMNVVRETSHGTYANFDFHDDAGYMKTLDEDIEWLFEKVMKQNGKGAIGWTKNMVVGGLWALAKKLTPLDKVDFLLDPLFSGASFTAYIPKYDQLYPEYDITAPIGSLRDLSGESITPSLNPVSVPEPASLTLLSIGSLMMLRRKRAA